MTVALLTPAIFALMVDRRVRALRGLRILIVGGDVMPAHQAARLREACPNVRLVNCYGPTEDGVVASAFPVTGPGAAVPSRYRLARRSRAPSVTSWTRGCDPYFLTLAPPVRCPVTATVGDRDSDADHRPWSELTTADAGGIDLGGVYDDGDGGHQADTGQRDHQKGGQQDMVAGQQITRYGESKALNPNMTVLAVDGSFASVLGGAPAAAVVFSADVDARTAADPRVRDLQDRVAAAGTERAALTAELDELRASVRAEKLGEVAAEFDRVHSIRRAVEVGSVDAVIRAAKLRPRIIEAVESHLHRDPISLAGYRAPPPPAAFDATRYDQSA